MQESGITNSGEQIKTFTREFVEKLKSLPLKEKIVIEGHSFYDSQGNLIMKIPIDETFGDLNKFMIADLDFFKHRATQKHNHKPA